MQSRRGTTINLGREIVTYVLREQDLKPFLDIGLNLTWLSSEEDHTSAAIFDQADEDAYRFILSHHAKHRRVPQIDLFQRSFPGGTYRLPESSYAVSELLSLVEEEIERYLVAEAGAEIVDLHDAGEFRKAGEVMEETARRLRATRVNRSVAVYWDDPDTDIEEKIHREVKRGIFTGIEELDEAFPGWKDTDLITYIGSAKAGKTSLMLKSALSSWERGKRVMFLTVEMDATEITDKLDAMDSQIPINLYQRGQLRGQPADKLRKRRAEMNQFEPNFLVLQTTGTYTVTDLEDDIDRYEPDVIYLDGFYFLIDRITGKSGGHWEGHDNLARELKETAMKRRIPVIVSTQVREKQLKNGMDDGAMMGGTGLIMASSMVLAAHWDKDSKVHTFTCTRSRNVYLPDIRGTWDWSKAEFNVLPPEEEEDENAYADAGF